MTDESYAAGGIHIQVGKSIITHGAIGGAGIAHRNISMRHGGLRGMNKALEIVAAYRYVSRSGAGGDNAIHCAACIIYIIECASGAVPDLIIINIKRG